MDNALSTEKDVVSKMAKFNFQNPVKVTVILDDDDNENMISNVKTCNRKQVATSNKYRITEEAMLNQVAQNMAIIMSSYYSFLKYNSVTTDVKVMNHYRSLLLEFRLNYFNLSLNISEKLLLPREKNFIFFDMLIKKTLSILKMDPETEYHKIKSLYNDLLQWTKRKRKRKQGVGQKTMRKIQPKRSSHSHSRVNKKIPNATNGRDNTSSKNINSQSLDTVTVFCGGTPGNELTINVNTKYLSKETISVSAQHHTTSLTETRYTNQTVFTSANNNTCNPNQPTDNYLLGLYLPQSNCQQPVNQGIMNMNMSQNNLNIQTMQTNQQDSFQRSASIDSGIISPDTFDASTETMNYGTSQRVYQFDDVSTPVTPNVSNNINTAIHQCIVCGKVTDMFCLGCSTYYYCSTNCQKSHWKQHGLICHLIAKNN